MYFLIFSLPSGLETFQNGFFHKFAIHNSFSYNFTLPTSLEVEKKNNFHLTKKSPIGPTFHGPRKNLSI